MHLAGDGDPNLSLDADRFEVDLDRRLDFERKAA